MKSLEEVTSGDFIRCIRIHEDQLVLVETGDPQIKTTGAPEHVNWYEVPGKLRFGLVLNAFDDALLVWYCFSDERFKPSWLDVSGYTRPSPPNRAYLKPYRGHIRSIPRTRAWCGGVVSSLDKVVLDGFLKKAQQLDRNVWIARSSRHL